MQKHLCVVLLLVLHAAILRATEFYVSPTGNDGNDGLTPATAKQTIQAAINAASSNDIINVAAGTYAGSILVNKLLTLRGPNTGVDPCTATRSPEAIITGTDPLGVVKVAANSVVIDGFKIVPVGTGTYGVLIQNQETNLTVRYVVFDASASDRDAINLWEGTGAHIHHNKIQDAVFGIGGGSDDASNPTSAVIEDNCISNTRLGITGYHDGSTIRRNTVENFVAAPPAAGISGQLLNTTVSNNSISNYPQGAGIALTAFPPRPHSSNVQISGNTVTGNGAGIFLDAAATLVGVEAHFNSISGNLAYGVLNASSVSFDAGCNWWGSALGPTHAGNPIGDGDIVNGTVVYYPWLGSYPSTVCGSGRGEKVLAKTVLAPYLTHSDRRIRDAATKATQRIDESLAADLWLDGNHLTNKGKKVFDKEKDATVELMEKILKNYTGQTYTDALAAILHLVTGDATLAQVAINEVECNGVPACVRELAKANDEMAKGQTDSAQGRYDKAIDHYRKAWESAMKAAGKALSKPGSDENGEMPSSYALFQNYPNPFNPATLIRFALPVDAEVSIEVFNVLGQKVADLVNGKLAAGYHTLPFDATSLASGVYIYRMSAREESGENFLAVRKMMLVR